MDLDHLAHIRRLPDRFAPGGLLHLTLEVVAYAADEAAALGSGNCTITLCADGSVAVADDGRGTDTRTDDKGAVIKKPVMATRDLRFFDSPDPPLLPDGRPRRGMSVVAALSGWLLHVNRRANGSWTQRYEDGAPVTGLVPIPGDGSRGTTVHFHVDDALHATGPIAPTDLARLVCAWPDLHVEVHDLRGRR